MEIHKLTDTQLYALHQSRYLAKSLSRVINDECNRRNFSAAIVESLIHNVEITSDSKPQLKLSLGQKAFVFLLPFPREIHSMIINRTFSKAEVENWKKCSDIALTGLHFRIVIFFALLFVGVIRP